MNKNKFNFKIEKRHILCFYKEKELFKVSNNMHNAINLLKLIEK